MATQEEKNLKKFVETVGQVNNNNISELVHVSLALLKTTPAVRDAVLDFFSTLFNMAVRTYLTNIETEIATGNTIEPSEAALTEDQCITSVHSALCSYITSNPQAWAPIVSTWSLQLLGQLSTRYAGRAHIPVDAGLNEKMQLWMGCRATRTLMDITTQCLSCFMDSDTQTCIGTLLDSSVKHSPHFDWVVAHVGSCFPDTVITRVLSCGLKDFGAQSRAISSKDNNRLVSVVGILGHLASSHFDDIRTAMLDLFKKSLITSNNLAVPYLLQLASLSPTIREILTNNIQDSVNVKTIIKLSESTFEWCKYFAAIYETNDALLDLAVNLALGCKKGGIQIFNLLLDTILTEETPVSVKANCRMLMESILLEIDSCVRSGTDINILSSMNDELGIIEQMLTDTNELRLETACNIIILLGNKYPTSLIMIASFLLRRSKSDTQLSLLIKILSDYLNNQNIGNNMTTLSQAIEHAIAFTEVNVEEEDYNLSISDIEMSDVNTSSEKLNDIKGNLLFNKSSKQDLNLNLWENLLKLLKWEISHCAKEKESETNSSNIFESLLKNQKSVIKELQCNLNTTSSLLSGKMVSKAIFINLMEISLIFGDSAQHPHISHIIADILINLDFLTKKSHLNSPSLELVLHLTMATVKYFFTCCLEKDIFLRATYSSRACVLLNKLSLYVNAARTLALRELLEHSLFKPQSVLFGAKFNSEKTTNDDLLLYQNLKQGTSTLLQRDSSIFHAGVIGTGVRKSVINNTIDKDIITENTTWLVRALEACCTSEQIDKETISVDSSKKQEDDKGAKPHSLPICLAAMEKVSLFLIENISSDVMYNGLPWPDEEHMKVTIERDLHIRRLFNNIPLLWELMGMLAKYPPSICFCSVLLRALTATLLHQWNALGHGGAAHSAKEQAQVTTLTEQTVKLLDLMAMGQLLPKPLSNIRDVIPFLMPHEISTLLRESVWNYMRPNEHVPSPALFSIDSAGRHYRDPDSIRPPAHYTDTLRLILQRNIDKLGEHFWLMFDTTNDDSEYNEYYEPKKVDEVIKEDQMNGN